jgi:peptidoglycan/xylan/chitin deacetylase (PgdA/CDA1 family)
VKRQLLAKFLSRSGFLYLLKKSIRWSGLLVLNYHRIGRSHTSVFDKGLWSATPEAFDDQVRYCKKYFDIISPEDIPHISSRAKGRYVLITFDDGYLDNYLVAFPILKSHGAKATFFISTGFIDIPQLPWWDEIAWMVRTSRINHVHLPSWLPNPVIFDEPDREQSIRSLLRAYKTMPGNITGAYLDALGQATGTGRYAKGESVDFWMTWDMLREMRTAGMSIGGHTVTHPILAQMTREQQWYEISACGRRLAEELGEPMRSFSYPIGNLHAFNNTTRECLRQVDVQFAFSYYGGFRRFCEWDNYDIRRMAIEEYVTPDWFRAMVSLPSMW